jgi:hypothetical protein
MEGLGDLFKQIGQIDSTLKLIAFLASIVVIIVLALLKKQTDLPKNVMNILMTLFVMVFLLALAAMFIHADPKGPGMPATYTLTVTVTDSALTPYRTDQAKVTVNNQDAPEANSSTSNTWSFLFHEDELPKDRRVLISASTNDHVYFANQLDTLSYDPHQTKMLQLGRGHVNTFSINLSDTAISGAIARITGLTYDPTSLANKVTVTGDQTSVTPDNNGIYSMAPFHPIVVIDGHRFALEGCTVPPPEINVTRHKEELTSYAQLESLKIATSFLRRNPNVLAQWLKSMQH